MNTLNRYMKQILSIFILLAAFTNAANCQSAVEVAKKAFESTVLLVMEDSSGQPLQIGSGFLVEPGVIATNMHVIEGASSGYAKFVQKKKKYDLLGIVASNDSRDLVLLKIASDLAPALSLANSEDLEIGQSVYAVGNPKGLEGTFSQGIISGIRILEKDTLLQITAPISPGSSGGPVLNERSEVVGISVATFKEGQNLNFAIPSNYLMELLAKKGQLQKFDPSTSRNPSGLTSGLGDSGVEGVVGTQFLWDYGFSQSSKNDYSFSFKNNLRENVSNVWCLVIFHDENDEPVEVDLVEYRGTILARLAKRVESSVDNSIYSLTTKEGSQTPHARVEIRIMGFKIEE